MHTNVLLCTNVVKRSNRVYKRELIFALPLNIRKQTAKYLMLPIKCGASFYYSKHNFNSNLVVVKLQP